MADSTILPGARARLIQQDGTTSPEFFRLFQALARAAGLTGDLQAQVTQIIKVIDESAGNQGRLMAGEGINVQGAITNGGVATISLEDSGVIAGDYGDDSTFATFSVDEFGRITVAGAVTISGSDGVTVASDSGSMSITMENLANTLAGSLVGISRDGKGRVSGTKPVIAGDGLGIIDVGSSIEISLVGLPVFLLDEDGNQLTDESGNFLLDSETVGLPTPFSSITDTPTTLAGYGITDAQKVGNPVKMPAYTLLTLPSAATYIDCLVVCTNLTEGRRLVYSDGTNWLRLTNNTVAN